MMRATSLSVISFKTTEIHFSYPQAFNSISVSNPHILSDFSDFHLCKFVANCIKQIDNSYLLKKKKNKTTQTKSAWVKKVWMPQILIF